MKLYHYSSDPLASVGNVKQANISPLNNHGWYPRGLWFAPGRTWKTWSSEFRDKDSFSHRYEVRIGIGARIIDLATPELAVEFTDRFGVKPSSADYGVMKVRWEDVEKEADGIRLGFKPRSYLHHIDKKIDWTEAWDIPAGCVWNFADVEVADNDGRILPRVPVHKHWLEDYGEKNVSVEWKPMAATTFLRMDTGETFEVAVDKFGLFAIPAEVLS